MPATGLTSPPLRELAHRALHAFGHSYAHAAPAGLPRADNA